MTHDRADDITRSAAGRPIISEEPTTRALRCSTEHYCLLAPTAPMFLQASWIRLSRRQQCPMVTCRNMLETIDIGHR